MFRARIELATSLKSCLSQLLCHAELWLTMAQQKLFDVIPHNFEKHCKLHAKKFNVVRWSILYIFWESKAGLGFVPIWIFFF